MVHLGNFAIHFQMFYNIITIFYYIIHWYYYVDVFSIVYLCIIYVTNAENEAQVLIIILFLLTGGTAAPVLVPLTGIYGSL